MRHRMPGMRNRPNAESMRRCASIYAVSTERVTSCAAFPGSTVLSHLRGISVVAWARRDRPNGTCGGIAACVAARRRFPANQLIGRYPIQSPFNGLRQNHLRLRVAPGMRTRGATRRAAAPSPRSHSRGPCSTGSRRAHKKNVLELSRCRVSPSARLPTPSSLLVSLSAPSLPVPFRFRSTHRLPGWP